MCLSADAFNLACRNIAIVCASVRGNLIENYRLEYGLKGLALAIAHLVSLRFFDRVVAMNRPMANQIAKYIDKEPCIVGNFVDEMHLARNQTTHREQSVTNFVFVGSLTPRKRPLLLVDALKTLHRKGLNARLDFVGDGNLRPDLECAIANNQLGNFVHIHGFLENPLDIVNNSDVMVLPSISEGTPRAALEALYLGVPCVLADVDGNSELITDNQNGALFPDESFLADAMIRAAKLSERLGVDRECLLPSYCRQNLATLAYINIMENLNSHDYPR